MSEALHADDSQTEDVTLEYGDQFRNTITDDVVTVQDVRDGEEKVLLTAGGFEWRSELEAAERGDSSMYEPCNRGRY